MISQLSLQLLRRLKGEKDKEAVRKIRTASCHLKCSDASPENQLFFFSLIFLILNRDLAIS